MVRPAGETAQRVRSPASQRSAGERGRGGAWGRGQSHDCGSRGTAVDRGERQQHAATAAAATARQYPAPLVYYMLEEGSATTHCD